MTTAPPAVARELMDVTASLRRVVLRQVRRDLPVKPLRGAEVELLGVVAAQPGIGVAAAARQLDLAANTVSTLVNQLVARGLLRRGVDDTDRRAAHLSLTDVAEQRMADWRDRRARVVAAALADLRPDDVAALDSALPALRRLLARLREDL